MANPTLSTKLSAVNSILSSIGQRAVSALDATADATMAEQLLDEVNVEVQSEGWKFNTEVKDLTADGSGYVILDTNVCRADVPQRYYKDIDVVMRGDPADSDQMKLYNLTDNTFNLGASAVISDVYLVYLLEYIHIPEAARNYITLVACRRFQQRMLGTSHKDRELFEQTVRSRARLVREESLQADRTIFDNRTSYYIVNRRSPLDTI